MARRLQFEAGDRIELAIGQPDLAILPLRELERAAAHRLGGDETDFLQYGPVAGSEPMRRLLADFLTTGYRTDVDPDELFLAAGASHALDLVAGHLAEPGDVVFVEEPTYHLAAAILAGRRLEIVPIPVDDDGLDVALVEREIESRRPRLIYTIPLHHNPSSVTLSPERRRRLADLAREHDFLIVADEVYQLLTYRGESPSPFRTVDPERVISIGSFSKILAPGLRFGWIEGAPEHLERIGRCGVRRSGGGVSPFTSAILESAIELGIQSDYLERVRELYRSRSAALIDALRRELPDPVRFREPAGGFFVWLELPDGIDAAEHLPAAHELGVGYHPGRLFTPRDRLANCLRLSFAYYDEERLREAAGLLGRLFRPLVG